MASERGVQNPPGHCEILDQKPLCIRYMDSFVSLICHCCVWTMY